MPACTNEFAFESPAVLADFLCALNTWQPVRPERVSRSIVEMTAKQQTHDMVTGRACPVCSCGLLGWDDVICPRCQAEIDEAEET